MIVHALRTLGGRGTGLEITTFIANNYPEILHNKTVTWRNSVMGCLSANRRNLFSKEPVRLYAKRYVWVLNEQESKEEILENDLKRSSFSKRRKFEEKKFSQENEENLIKNKKTESSSENEDEGENSQQESEENQIENCMEEESSPNKNLNTEKNLTIPNNCQSGNTVELISEALLGMGGKATGVEIAEWLAAMYAKILGSDVKKLGYMVNAILSSKKYKNKFSKDKMVQGGQRALWKLTY